MRLIDVLIDALQDSTANKCELCVLAATEYRDHVSNDQLIISCRY